MARRNGALRILATTRVAFLKLRRWSPHSYVKLGSLFASIVAIALSINSCGSGRKEASTTPDFQSVDLAQVRGGGELGRRFNLALRENFFRLDVENDFLLPFRDRKPKEEVKGFRRFVGLGMLIDAAVKFARATDDPEVVARKDYVIEETIQTQSPSGYIGIYAEEADGGQLWSEYCFHDAAYTTFGLAEDYRHFGNAASLEAARKLADYLMSKWPNRPPGNYFTTLGAHEAYLSLYDLTGDSKYLRFASDEPMGRKFEISPGPLRTWQQQLHPIRPLTPEEIAEQPQDVRKLKYVHIYRTMATTLMQIRLNQIEPRDNLLVMSRRFIDGMTRPNKPGLLVTGVLGEHEAWHENQAGRGRIAENCATVYELWFLDELLRLDDDLRYGDIIERAMYNTLFGSQDPKGRQICYFTPFSGKREYFERDTYCCPNNFRRGMAKLPGLIYYQSPDGVAINLYSSSSANFELSDGTSLEVVQKTDYPTLGLVQISLLPAQPVSFALRLRIPRWSHEATVTVGIDPAEQVHSGEPFFEIAREWRAGDTVVLEFGMTPRWVAGKELQQGRAALLRGPVLYGLNTDRNPAANGMELREIMLDPDSVEGPFPDESIRPNGTAFRVRAWSPGRESSHAADLSLTLTEFVDPGSEEIYFRLPDLDRAVVDELLRPAPASKL